MIAAMDFAPGCDLWIVAPPATSHLARKVDWYLNFQIMKAELHRRPEIGSEISAIFAREERVPLSVPVAGENLMIDSAQLLPNRATVVVPFATDAAAWAKECHRVWQGMGRVRTRVFLPDGVDEVAFRSSWPAADREKLEISASN